MGTPKFVIECIDHETGSIKFSNIFELHDEAKLCEIISPGDSCLFRDEIYDVSPEEMLDLKGSCGIRFVGDVDPKDTMILRLARDLDELPYQVHTNRELIMMLNDEKPLSVFSEPYPNTTGVEIIPESFFDSYVRTGLFVKREFIDVSYPGSKGRVVLYARGSEEWRIDAYILMRQSAFIFGWNETFEIIEGALLGYEPWQTEIYINRIYRPKFGRN